MGVDFNPSIFESKVASIHGKGPQFSEAPFQTRDYIHEPETGSAVLSAC